MPKRVPVEAKRVPLNCLVLPETMAWLKTRCVSQGTSVDYAVAAYRMQEAQGRIETTYFPARNRVVQSKLRPPLLKPSEKKK